MSHNNHQPELTLEVVKSHFTEWRETRSKPGRIPSPLWDEVGTLLKHYSISKVASTLAVSYQQLRDRFNLKPKVKPKAIKNEATFVEAGITPSVYNQSFETTEITLVRQDGVTIKIKTSDNQLLKSVINQLLGETACCN